MIHLIKLDEPQILKDNKRIWTARYLECINNEQEVPHDLKYRYREPSIKAQILKETHNKCAYCESKVSHICPGDVEHILPKNKDARPDLYVEWTNLTLACEECNRTGKRTYYNISEPLINPYNDNPEDHLMAVGSLVFNKNSDRKGFITQNILELNRIPLLEMRTERLESVKSLVDTWSFEQNNAVKSVLENELKKEAAPDREYSFIIKEYLKLIGIVV